MLWFKRGFPFERPILATSFEPGSRLYYLKSCYNVSLCLAVWILIGKNHLPIRSITYGGNSIHIYKKNAAVV